MAALGDGVLVSHWMPLANAALSAGHAAFRAQRAAQTRWATYTAAAARPLPETVRERGWAVRTRERLLAEAEAAAATAAQRVAEWARLMDRLGELDPVVAGEVDYTVWGVPHRAAAAAAIAQWEASRLPARSALQVSDG